MQVEIRKLDSQEIQLFKELIRVFEVVFEMKDFRIPEDEYLQKLLAQEGFYVFVTLQDAEVIGGLTAYTLNQYYSRLPLVYIYDLAVATQFQRKGIGQKLISGITSYCKQIGVEEVFVQADEVDDYALDFYHKTGATAEKVVHFYYPLNKG
ncbi:GNAT family N-acetyltransferase [Adhaeribacter rhizoryzae]|uniref:GNAT family N-acetyltransferase n=1 Tax=Adhaeribacter rhizoryzae TaxID=2607907 RepID=A0A5M6DSF6_9BACT|nr:GNAT family N-acetyltransferase [Adhaeribacter rhizoryzae]KAA5549162.1 GNAT family N-acetyltransferase [Adhaeribacter rhizoryzae]